jgi:hypothetical protein
MRASARNRPVLLVVNPDEISAPMRDASSACVRATSRSPVQMCSQLLRPRAAEAVHALPVSMLAS